MSFLNLYSSNSYKGDIGHFANLMKLAVLDENISENEQNLINRIKKRLNISDAEYDKIVKDPKKIPINPPVSYNDRIERLYNLTKMIEVDHNPTEKGVRILGRVVVGLGFHLDTKNVLVEKAMELIENGVNLEGFNSAIKKVNKIR